MDLQYSSGLKSNPTNKMILEDLKSVKNYDPPNDLQMTSSIVSVTSSLTSPVDSGVQLLDSESDITSVMSMSGTACDLESHLSSDAKENEIGKSDTVECLVLTSDDKEASDSEKDILPNDNKEIDLIGDNKENSVPDITPVFLKCPDKTQSIMTKSDIANQNITSYDCGIYSSSAPSTEIGSKKELELDSHAGKESEEKHDVDKLVSGKDNVLGGEMHVSVSEEVKESQVSSQIDTNPPPADEQIVFRRQRKKKSNKSDTPKKRVSFHEDILNSTKTDDIHINHGFITQQPDISMSFFNWDSIRKKDVVKGRYSWAAEGDTPYYHRNVPERETKSEIYANNYSSSSSSSADSVDSSSSNSLCDNDSNSDGTNKPVQKLPKSSCLKKRTNTKHIETLVVEESLSVANRHRKSESNLLDSNIFGSLKNILSLSSSVPLAERGVPEGQEDVSVYSSNQNLSSASKQRAFGNRDSWVCKSVDRYEKLPEMPRRNTAPMLESGRSQLKIVPAETPHSSCPVANIPPNVLVCDSTVYEHKGISYSYEYDKFQKSFETHAVANKPKSSTVYQLLLQDLNFFKKRDKSISETPKPGPTTSTPAKDSQSSKSDWSSDTTETVSDVSENMPSKHLCSPKHKVKPNHYSVQNFKASDSGEKNDDTTKSCQSLKSTSSKTSLINRFLRNVTMKKLLDAKLHKKHKLLTNKCMGLYMRGAKPDEQLCRDLDLELRDEILRGKRKEIPADKKLGSNFILRLKKEVFRDPTERLFTYYKVRSVYNSLGETKSLLVFLTNATLYVTGFKPNQTFKNYFVLPYCELNTILIGPNAHTIHLSNSDRQMQCLLSTGSSEITGELIGRLEMAMRSSICKPPLPAVRHLTMRDMPSLRYEICRQTAVQKDEEYFHYSIVNIQEVNCEPAATPLGPIKEGPLMFKTANDVRWETGYFILKGGVLYMLSSPSNRLPMQVLPLSGGACLGAHRTPYCLRPHTFELLLSSVTLQLAAPDEYVASDWLQVLVQTASGLFSNHEVNHTQACTLLLTSAHILTMREKFPGIGFCGDDRAQTLSCAAISDITALRIPLAEQSWCILEFACREVHETSGDLVVYFATNTELERFLSTLEMLWSYNNIKGDSFPLSTIDENEPINKKCVDAYRTLQMAWSAAGVNLD